MSLTYKYQNQFGKEITQKQIDLGLEYFSKIYYENGVPKIEETYKNGQLINTSKYVSTEQEIINELILNPNASFDYIFVENGYKIHEIRTYGNNILTGKGVTVFNSENKIICSRNYTVENGIITHQRTEKSYYDSNGELLYNFDYNADGTCFLISNEQDPQGDIYAWNIGDADVPFTWQGFEYYQNEEPLIPS